MKRKLFFALLALSALPLFGLAKPGFMLWQLASQVNTIGNSYVFLTDNGRVVVMDGGMKEETLYLRGFLAALGNEVEAWIVSHPHNDHVGALTEILKSPQGINIHEVYYSCFPEELIALEEPYAGYARDFYAALDKSGVPVVNLTEPGLTVAIDGLNFKILGVTNPELTMNPYNNSSMIVRVWDKSRSFVFLGDAGVECGDKVLAGPYRKDLDCDYLQVAHHGQQGCSEAFYKSIKFKACLWPTPSWVWNNDGGQGYNTAHLKTIETRRWMDEIGIKKHYVSWQGLVKIE